ncbi:MAG: DUF3500 domain-containing protein [Planctomycetaceae bacterium]|nr:DUF3500 domain-containing protein [Planctomycetaceae bacterium]
MTRTSTQCPECSTNLSRREFVRVVGTAAVAAASSPLLPTGKSAVAAPTKTSAAESAVQRLYETVTPQQASVICLPFDHASRFKINANWEVTEPLIGSDFYTDEQRALINDILKGVTSEDGYERFVKQMDYDSGGVGEYACAIFGKPGTDQFQFELTGRHLTVRADGNTVPGAAFGGPIVYGHGEEDPAQNLFHYQTKKVNEVFQALDPSQRQVALLKEAPRENDVPLQGDAGRFPGLAVNSLSADQKELVESVVRTLLAPYRQEDVDEVASILKEGGGLNQLHMAFYEAGDLGNDGEWDVWRVEGPSFVWHFRGAPHVHAYINIGLK